MSGYINVTVTLRLQFCIIINPLVSTYSDNILKSSINSMNHCLILWLVFEHGTVICITMKLLWISVPQYLTPIDYGLAHTKNTGYRLPMTQSNKQ